jgi:hypothetical protein
MEVEQMKILVREKVFGINTVDIQEVDDMKCKCSICVLWFGNAPKSEKLKLKTIEGRDFLVCGKHREVNTLNRREYEKGRYSAKPVS